MSAKEPTQLSQAEIDWLKQLPMSRRAAAVRDHIIEHGSVSTQELADDYGYGHPPRAAGDLKDAGAGVVTVMVPSPNGRRMASYRFNGKANQNGAGRVVIPKPFADSLKKSNDFKCSVCTGEFAGRELQADHRIPFRIAGDKPIMDHADFMPLCASDNRAKSWSCEHCDNWEIRDVTACVGCFWAHPENYSHVALRNERRINLIFQGGQVQLADRVAERAVLAGQELNDFVKDLLA